METSAGQADGGAARGQADVPHLQLTMTDTAPQTASTSGSADADGDPTGEGTMDEGGEDALIDTEVSTDGAQAQSPAETVIDTRDRKSVV